MGTSTTKRQLQAALALTLLACSGLTGCSGSQEQGATNAGSSKAAVASTQAKTPRATPKASGASTATSTPTATASPTITMTPELEASKKRALATQPPAKPELITVNSDDGAIATAKYWVQLHYYIYTTGKVDEYKALCNGDESTAVAPIKYATGNHTSGGWTDPVVVNFTAAFRRDDFKEDVVVQVNFEREAYTSYGGDGEIEYFPKQSRYAGVKLEYNGTQWIVKVAFNRER
jgi:lipoprotein